MDEVFHNWFCEQLRIPISSVIYPTENLAGDRPDFIVKDADRIIGYIEVESGDENKSQLSSIHRLVSIIHGEIIAVRWILLFLSK